MKVDFEKKVIEIETGDDIKKLGELVDKHNLSEFKLEPRQYQQLNVPYQVPSKITTTPYVPNQVFYTK